MTQTIAAAHSTKISSDALDQLFRRHARVRLLPSASPRNAAQSYELARMGRPVRILLRTFCVSRKRAAKGAFCPPSSTQCRKNEAAPVTVIVAWDTEFYEKLPSYFLTRYASYLWATSH